MELKFGERLTELMDERKFSSNKLAKESNITVQTINRWKRNASKIYLLNLIKICDVLDCSIEFIIGLTDTVLDYVPKPCPPFYIILRQVIKEKGISRYKIVQNTKIYDNYFTVWKKGRDPQIYSLIELAEFIGCTIDYLIGRDI